MTSLSDTEAVKITREDFEDACALVESMKPGKSMVDVAARFLAAYRRRIASSTPPAEPVATTQAPDAVERTEEIERLIRNAYEQGAHDVHNNWQEDRDPDFSEAASDYLASLDLAALSTLPTADDVCAELAAAFGVALEPGWWRELPARIEARLSEKEAEIGRLKEALEPFCEFADIEDVPAAMIEINDFRNEDGVSYFAIARTALSKEGGR